MTKREVVKLARKWAAAKKNAAKVRRLSKYMGDCRNLITDNEHNEAYGVCERMFFVMCPQHDGDRGESGWFWHEVVGDEYPKAEHAEAFILAAIDTYQGALL